MQKTNAREIKEKKAARVASPAIAEPTAPRLADVTASLEAPAKKAATIAALFGREKVPGLAAWYEAFASAAGARLNAIVRGLPDKTSPTSLQAQEDAAILFSFLSETDPPVEIMTAALRTALVPEDVGPGLVRLFWAQDPDADAIGAIIGHHADLARELGKAAK